MIDLAQVRDETPGTLRGSYLNAAGAALMPLRVTDAVKAHIDLESQIGGYAAADHEAERLSQLYQSVGRLINASSEEIAICESATVAWQRAFYSLSFKRGDRIVTAQSEYAANYVAFLQTAQRLGVEIVVGPNDDSGALDVEALDDLIDERVKLIAITWIPTNGGLVNPAAAVGQVARKYGVPYLLDACQAVGQMPVDVEAIGCDMLAATGRKFLRAPRGTGFLYLRRAMLDVTEPAMIDHAGAPWIACNEYRLRPDARRFEPWESNIADRLGLATAVDYALELGLDVIEACCRHLASRLRDGLRRIAGAQVRDLGRNPSAIVSFTLDGIDARTFVRCAKDAGIAIGVSEPASTRLDAEARHLPTVIRASPHYYNSDDDIDRLLSLTRSTIGPRATDLPRA